MRHWLRVYCRNLVTDYVLVCVSPPYEDDTVVDGALSWLSGWDESVACGGGAALLTDVIDLPIPKRVGER